MKALIQKRTPKHKKDDLAVKN